MFLNSFDVDNWWIWMVVMVVKWEEGVRWILPADGPFGGLTRLGAKYVSLESSEMIYIYIRYI